MSPILFVGAGIVLLGAGLGLGYWLAHSQRMREANRASSVQKELDDYRREVGGHFNDTAQHFQVIGQQIQALYKHMAEGAESLCDTSESGPKLSFAAGSVLEITAGEQEVAPEVVRDYALDEEVESTSAEIETVNAPDPEEETTVAVEAADESVKDDVAAEPIAATEPSESERTVH